MLISFARIFISGFDAIFIFASIELIKIPKLLLVIRWNCYSHPKGLYNDQVLSSKQNFLNNFIYFYWNKYSSDCFQGFSQVIIFHVKHSHTFSSLFQALSYSKPKIFCNGSALNAKNLSDSHKNLECNHGTVQDCLSMQSKTSSPLNEYTHLNDWKLYPHVCSKSKMIYLSKLQLDELETKQDL